MDAETAEEKAQQTRADAGLRRGICLRNGRGADLCAAMGAGEGIRHHRLPAVLAKLIARAARYTAADTNNSGVLHRLTAILTIHENSPFFLLS